MNGPTQFIQRNDTLLVVVDVQEKLFPVIQENVEMANNIITLVKAAKILGVETIYAEQKKLGPTIEPIRDALGGVPLFEKTAFGCFGDGGFAHHVKESGKTTLLVCGIEAHVCVMQTSLGALQRDMRVQVVADAVNTRLAHNKAIGLDRIEKSGGEITSTEAVIFELMNVAGTDEFRQILPLIK